MKNLWHVLLGLCLVLSACTGQPETGESPQLKTLDTISPSTNEENLPEPAEQIGPVFLYGRSFLSTEAQMIYDQLWDLACRFELEAELSIPRSVELEEVERLIVYFWSDNPQYYWAAPSVTTNSATGDSAICLQLVKGLEEGAVLKELEEVEAAAQALLEDLWDLSLTDWELALKLHNRLVFNTHYNRYSKLEHAHTLYGGLVNRSVICDGYSRTYQYLMQRMGIPCIYVAGQTLRGLTHSWNAVLLEDEWYYVDLTWDDRGRIRHDYCLVSLEEMEREHVWDNTQYPYLPDSGSGGMDYYLYSGFFVEPGPEDEVLEALAQAFAKQLAGNPQYIDWETAFLEVKVLGSREEYLAVRELYIQRVFDILRRTDRILEEWECATRIANGEEISCNYNDEMHILTMFPITT